MNTRGNGAAIIWVDEDERIWAPERWLLEGKGITVEPISDATTAWKMIRAREISAFRLIILDVMLLQGDDTELFSDIATNQGTKTGLVLAERLYAETPEICKKMLFFSRVTEAPDRAEIVRCAKKIGAHYLYKGDETQGYNFIKWLRDKGFL